jgi:hypothetical protein
MATSPALAAFYVNVFKVGVQYSLFCMSTMPLAGSGRTAGGHTLVIQSARSNGRSWRLEDIGQGPHLPEVKVQLRQYPCDD